MAPTDKYPTCVAIILSCRKYLSTRVAGQNMDDFPFEFRYFVGECSSYDHIALPVNIIQLPCPDNYEGLVFKVYEAIKWVDQNLDFEYILKSDDDIVFDPKSILKLYNKVVDQSIDYAGSFKRPPPSSWSYLHRGCCDDPILNSIPVLAPQEQYASGGGYFLSKRAVKAYLDHFSLMRKDLIFEDGFMGACLKNCPVADTIRQGRWSDDFRKAFVWDDD